MPPAPQAGDGGARHHQPPGALPVLVNSARRGPAGVAVDTDSKRPKLTTFIEFVVAKFGTGN